MGWQSFYGITLPYVRGFAYFLKVATQLQDSVGDNESGLDQIVRTLLKRKNRGHRCAEVDWTDLLAQHLGEEAKENFDAMASGKLVIPGSGALGLKYTLVRKDKERFDTCIDPASIGMRRVTGLKVGSRAALSGLREGDRILDSTFVWLCEAHFGQMMSLNVRRDGVEMEILYWPRSWEKVEAWEFVPVEGDWEFVDLAGTDMMALVE